MRARAKVNYNEDKHEREFKAAIKVLAASSTEPKKQKGKDQERRSTRNTGKENQKRYRWEVLACRFESHVCT